MKIITILTDFGYQDPYVGIMKGVMLKISPQTALVDISHDVPSFGIRHAAFSLFSYYRYFPENSIHLIVVDPGVGSERKAIVAKIDHYYFVLPDNGIISYVWHAGKEKIAYVLENKKYFLTPVSHTFHGRDIFSPVAAYIARDIPLKEFGPLLEKPDLFPFLHPKRGKDGLEGEVIYTDKFGNIVTDIEKKDILSFKRFYIKVRGVRIDKLVKYYGETKRGERFGIFGSTGFLELSENQGNLSRSLNVSIGDKVDIISV